MARPTKCRRICTMPGFASFGPQAGEKLDTVIMTVDEFEAIRLIDLEGLVQEAAALRMNVARTTVQAIYNSARIKLADCLVNGKLLHISGGEVELCDGAMGCCPHRGGCCRRAEKGDNN